MEHHFRRTEGPFGTEVYACLRCPYTGTTRRQIEGHLMRCERIQEGDEDNSNHVDEDNSNHVYTDSDPDTISDEVEDGAHEEISETQSAEARGHHGEVKFWEGVFA